MLLPSHFYGNLPLFQAIPSQGKSEGFDRCGWPSNLTQTGLKSSCNLEIWWMTSKNNKAPLLYYIKLCAAFQSHSHIQTGVAVRKRSIRVKICNFLSRVTLKLTYDLESVAPLLYYVKLCASVQIHLWSQTWVTAWKRLRRVKIGDFFSRVTLKIDVWPLKTIAWTPLLCCFNLCV